MNVPLQMFLIIFTPSRGSHHLCLETTGMNIKAMHDNLNIDCTGYKHHRVDMRQNHLLEEAPTLRDYPVPALGDFSIASCLLPMIPFSPS